ncbi:hypothetical protein ACQPYK_25395 [Streptosporangium sp. CA-135522]|uniref:hypothetical protein n=1 Tax=Streptosporangium sp. CA-135522 TaxID=3240072 RepID=UPI003D8C140F
MQRRIEYMPLPGIPAAARNAKDHDLPAIRASIETFGCIVAGEIDERTGRLVVGHGRKEVLTAMAASGSTPPEGVRLAEDGTWLVPIVRGWSSRSDADAEAYLIANNRTTEKGGWDEGLLVESLLNIQQADAGLLVVTGYTADDLADLDAAMAAALAGDMGGAPGPRIVDDDDDERPMPQAQPPSEFRSFDEAIDVDYRCPSCSYEWSGKPK